MAFKPSVQSNGRTGKKKDCRTISDVTLKSIATAVPPHEIHQIEVEKFARRLFASRPKLFKRLAGVYANAGIDKRYSCVPLEWYEQSHGWKDRAEIFVDNAVDLLARAAQKAMDGASLVAADIDGIVTVSSTGVAVPSLDALLLSLIHISEPTRRM